MSRSHSKHLAPKQYRERHRDEDVRLKRVTKSHKQKRVNDRARLRREYL